MRQHCKLSPRVAGPPRCERSPRSSLAPCILVQVSLMAPASWEGNGKLDRRPPSPPQGTLGCHTQATPARHPSTMAAGLRQRGLYTVQRAARGRISNSSWTSTNLRSSMAYLSPCCIHRSWHRICETILYVVQWTKNGRLDRRIINAFSASFHICSTHTLGIE